MAKIALFRNGLKLDVKAIRRITNLCGDDLHTLRTHRVFTRHEGKLPATDELAGMRVTVQIDGGRTRLRKALTKATRVKEIVDADGLLHQGATARSKKPSKASVEATWREPKLCTIFIHDENGRTVKQSRATIDGPLERPDAMEKLVAMHLHRLGAAKALSITFVADGATWIWNRVGKMVSLTKIPLGVKIYQVLDCCHAVHHISLALAAMGQSEAERKPMYRVYSTLLRYGQWRQVVDELTSIAEELTWPKRMAMEIEYLRKHGEAGCLNFTNCRKFGFPIGNGAIESSIRRVINNRMKSNGTFWEEAC